MTDLTVGPIAILGLGVNNRELARYLLRKGYALTILDQNPAVRDSHPFSEDELSRITWDIRDDITDSLDRFAVVFRSPSISTELPGIQRAIAAGVLITSQTSYFLELCPAITIGVTGTKGKGTTSSLIAKILEVGYTKGKTYLAGNIGVDPFLFLEELVPEDIVVLELSSFQLEDCQYSPHIAVLLHVAIDHLDHHLTLQNYRSAKANLIRRQRPGDVAVINTGYPEMRDYLNLAKARTIEYSRATELPFSVAERRLRGEHNLENIIPAYFVAKEFGVSDDIIQKVVTSFPGLAHRLSYVGEVNGVSCYDDSIATTPESARVAIEAFPGRRIHIILGGRDKGADYTALARFIAQTCASVALLPGNTAEAFERGFKEVGYAGIKAVRDADAAVEYLLSQAVAGDVILLAPGTRSDTPYATYVERGDHFAQAVRQRMLK